MDEELKQRLQEKSTWERALYMLLFALIFGILEIIIAAVVVFQFFLTLFTGSCNQRLVSLGQGLSTYLYQITLFLTFNSNERPYPFGDWPEGTPANSAPATKKRSKTVSAKSSPAKSPAKSTGTKTNGSKKKSDTATDNETTL